MINAEKVGEAQYSAMCARRLQYDNLMWQTPVMSLIGMSFLFTIALGVTAPPGNRTIASALALVAALASAHLLAKHRYYEIHFAELLETIEDGNSNFQPVSSAAPKATWPLSLSAYKIWMGLFFLFAGAAFYVGIRNFLATSWGAKALALWH